MTLIAVLSGVVGGLILTMLIIVIVLLMKRSKNSGVPGGCSGSGKNGSDIVVISKDSSHKGSDGVSNNSSEMKVEVRTSSSLSNGEDCWEGSDDSGPRRQIIMPKTVDFVDGNVVEIAGANSATTTHLMAATLPPYNKADAVSHHSNINLMIERNEITLVITHFSCLFRNNASKEKNVKSKL